MHQSHHIFSCSLIGQREENQDNYVVLSEPEQMGTLIVVADGMGGHLGGKLAAEIVVNTARDLWESTESISDPKVFLTELVEQAHLSILASQTKETPDPQSTICALLIQKDTAISAHLGDTRVIQVKNGQIVKRTIDHSKAQLLALEGKIKESEIATHQLQSTLFRNLGANSDPRPEFEQWDTECSDFIVCTDGFWELFPADSLRAALRKIDSSEHLEKAISKRLEQTKNHDNVTAVIIRKAQIKSNQTLYSKKKAAYFAMLLVAFVLGILALFLVIQNTELPSTNDEQKETGNSEALVIDPSKNDFPTNRTSILSNDDDINDSIKDTTEHLKKSDLLGEDDALIKQGQSEQVENTQIIRTQQLHKGIPVHGAEAILTRNVDSDEIKINTKTVANINVDTQPNLAANEAIEYAQANADEEFVVIEPGELVIYKYDTYKLSWRYLIENAKGVRQSLIVDANSGEILLRISSNLPHPASDNQDE